MISKNSKSQITPYVCQKSLKNGRRCHNKVYSDGRFCRIHDDSHRKCAYVGKVKCNSIVKGDAIFCKTHLPETIPCLLLFYKTKR